MFAGTPEAAVPTLRALIDAGHEVSAVLTRPPSRQGRGRRTRMSPVHIAADELGLDVLTPRTLRDPDVAAQIRSIEADVVVVVAYGLLVPADLLEAFRHGWINLHFSLLPRWRGAAPVQRAIMEGDTMTGVTVFQIEAGLDTGPIYAQHPYPLMPDATTASLLERLAHHGADVMCHVLDALDNGTAIARPQSSDGVTYAHMITGEDAHLNFAADAHSLLRRVRALGEEPGCWAMIGQIRLKIYRLSILPTCDLEPGVIRVTKKEVSVGTATNDMLLAEVAAPGKRAMAGADWARGAHLGEAARFEVRP